MSVKQRGGQRTATTIVKLTVRFSFVYPLLLLRFTRWAAS